MFKSEIESIMVPPNDSFIGRHLPDSWLPCVGDTATQGRTQPGFVDFASTLSTNMAPGIEYHGVRQGAMRVAKSGEQTTRLPWPV